MNWQFEQEVKEKVRYKFHLIPLFHSTLNVPERIYEYNPRLFVCFNSKTNRYEIHSLDQEESFTAMLPYRSLDARAIRWIWKNDIRVHGREIFERLEKNEEMVQKRKDREFKNWVEAVGSETRSLFAKDAWTMSS